MSGNKTLTKDEKMTIEEKTAKVEKDYATAKDFALKAVGNRRYALAAKDILGGVINQILFDDEMLATQGSRDSELKLPALQALLADWKVTL